MSGISQCMVCGDLYYGDERDDFQMCSCPLTVIGHHGKTRRQFAEALAAAVRAADLTVREVLIRAGAKVYGVLLRSELDGPHTTLPNVGWVALVLDETLDEWSAVAGKKGGDDGDE